MSKKGEITGIVVVNGKPMSRAEAAVAWPMDMLAYGTSAWKITHDPETGEVRYDRVDLADWPR